VTLEARDLRLSYDGDPVVEDLRLRIARGRTTALVGPNASGKSTLLRALARLLRPTGGAVLLDGRDIARVPTREVARRMAILPQDPETPEGLTVRQLVEQGRYPHRALLRGWSPDDERAVDRALAGSGMAPLAERAVDTLSGGQRQHAWIAMTLAQETETLLLDEPTTYLDLAHQIDVLDLLAALNAAGRTIVMVLHDLNQAARYADEIIAVRAGRIAAAGPPHEVVREDRVRDVFGVDVRVIDDPVTGGPLCVPTMSARRPTPPIATP
jgi:iron complex transport system ATP-binding protein